MAHLEVRSDDRYEVPMDDCPNGHGAYVRGTECPGCRKAIAATLRRLRRKDAA